MDDLITAVRACPSGALSFALGGDEVRQQVDQDRQPTIDVSKDGPYRITGAIPLEDAEGQPGAAQRRRVARALQPLPLRSIAEQAVLQRQALGRQHFRDPVPDPDAEPTLFEWAGGFPALTRMTRIFYGKYVPQDPLLAPLFADMSPDHPERVAAWLGEVFGGPKAYSEGYGTYERMISQHTGRALRRSNALAGSSCSASRPTRPMPADPSGAPRSSPTWSGARGSGSRTPSRVRTRRRHAGAALVVGLQRDAGEPRLGACPRRAA